MAKFRIPVSSKENGGVAVIEGERTALIKVNELMTKTGRRFTNRDEIQAYIWNGIVPKPMQEALDALKSIPAMITKSPAPPELRIV